jgi:uncharacterized protein YjiS (DUF1127 family)
MSSHPLTHTIPLYRPAIAQWVALGADAMKTLLQRWRARRAANAQWRRIVRVERDLVRLSPETLRDIGAPEGIVGQRRWQEDQEAAQFARILNLHGW